MESYVLDTNLFFNMEPGLGIAKNTAGVLEQLTRAARVLKESGRGTIFMPVRIVEEFLGFFDADQRGRAEQFLKEVVTKSPDAGSIHFGAPVFYKLINDVRARNLRGMAIAEDEIVKAARAVSSAGDLSKKDFEIRVGPAVKSLRERYRQATRTGFLDSVADLDIIVLAKEVDGFIVSSDEGLLTWGRRFGVKEMRAPVFGSLVTELLAESPPK